MKAHAGTYNTGCRCADCRTYQRERVAANRAARASRLAAGDLDRHRGTGQLEHSTRASYDAGCRCEPCRLARRVAYVGEVLRGTA